MANSDTIKSFLGVDEFKNYKVVLRQLFSEFLGTLFYLSLVLHAAATASDGSAIIISALSNGLVIGTVIQIFGYVSGGHVNPAVTAGLLVCGYIKPLKALCYVVAQILGGISGSAIAYYTSVESIRGNLGAFKPIKDSSPEQVFVLEFLMTFLLVLVILSVLDQRRGARGLGSSSLSIGFCITACICSSMPYTGFMNPVRVFGPALMMDEWRYHWVLWTGPILGGVMAGVVYRYVLSDERLSSVIE